MWGARCLALAACWGLTSLLAPAVAQGPAAGTEAAPAVTTAVFHPAPGAKNEVVPAGCASCASGILGGPAPAEIGGGCAGGCGSCPGAAPCYPGQTPCDCCWDPQTRFGTALQGIYNCICCPDPCYEPRWVGLANSAFFVDQVRPMTQLMVRVDGGWDVRNPDKAELFWARANQKGPRFPGKVAAGANAPGEHRLDYTDGAIYMEGAVDRFGLFVETHFRDVSPVVYPSASGFGDMVLGTKSLLLDCELIQLTFQFRTFLPTGDFTHGLGTGHVSLDPSLIAALKVSPISYLQGQLGYRLPIGGTGGFDGSLFYAGLSYNHLLWNCGHDLELIGTLETDYYSITNGRFTDLFTGVALPADADIVNAGAGLRFIICRKIDFGVGASFALTNDRLAGHLVRAEFRWRF
jgi:hypothetical protein